ncbi:MAG TPA: hypothetical protein VN419_14135 [Humidesulfovibrio sp.]|uniref:hypothetical protein n=1 Tax=Humidesulfovibrio sp. TaxID=2910988 RepID=UPI002CFC6896|nr:hypothetical protein [Humidesulfovibrio sp.]HWR05141.1 hypothetical protein [Humidesulfovibrio sp.]
MKTSTTRGTFLAAVALSAALLLGQAQPSQAQTIAAPQAQAVTIATSTAWHGGGHGPMNGGCGW